MKGLVPFRLTLSMWHSRPPFSSLVFLSHLKPPLSNPPFPTHYDTYALGDSRFLGDKLRTFSPPSAANMQWSLGIHWLLLAGAGAYVTCEDQYESLGNVELDMVFPRNDTYPTLQRLPVVFAIRNPALSQNLDMSIRFYVDRALSDPIIPVGLGKYDMRSINTSSNDTHFEYRDFLRFDEEGTWTISWNVEWRSCTLMEKFDPQPNKQSTDLKRWRYQSTTFTTRNSTQNLDLVAATSKKNCSVEGRKSGFAIDIIGELNVTESEMNDGHTSDTCAVVPVYPSILDPCANYLTDACQFELDSSTASRISAATAALPCKNELYRKYIGHKCESDVASGAEKVDIKQAALMTVLFGIISLFLL
jgi:hypothetical protein